MPFNQEVIDKIKKLSPEKKRELLERMPSNKIQELKSYLSQEKQVVEEDNNKLSEATDFVMKQIKGGLSGVNQFIPYSDQIIGASMTARQLMSGDLNVEDIPQAFEQNVSSSLVTKKKSIKEAPVMGGIGMGLGAAGTAIATGGSSIPVTAGLFAGQAAGISSGEKLASGGTVPEAIESGAWSGTLSALLSGLPGVAEKALKSDLLKRGAKISKEGSKWLMEKFSGLGKRVSDGKLTPKQASEAAEELLNVKIKFPSIRNYDKVVKKQLNTNKNTLSNIYKKAGKDVEKTTKLMEDIQDSYGTAKRLRSGASQGKTSNAVSSKVIDLDEVAINLEKSAGVANEAGKFDVADDLMALVKDLRSGRIKSKKTIAEAWDISKSWGNRAYSKNNQLTKEALDEGRKLVKSSIDEAVEAYSGKGLIQKLRGTNAQTHKLLNASQTLKTEAAKKSASLVPDVMELGLFAASPYIPYSGAAAGVKYGGRVIQNVGTGAAAKMLHGGSKLLDKAAQFGPINRDVVSSVRPLFTPYSNKPKE